MLAPIHSEGQTTCHWKDVGVCECEEALLDAGRYPAAETEGTVFDTNIAQRNVSSQR